MPDNCSFAVVIVNYYNDDEVLNFLNSELLKQTLIPHIYIVNNGSNDISILQSFCDSRNQITLIDRKTNLGYLGAFITVVDDFLNNKKDLPDWITLSNSDIHFDKLFIQNFCQKRYPEKTAAIGPNIISTRTKDNQNPFSKERITRRKLKRLRIVFSNYVFYFLYQMLHIAKRGVRGLFKRKGSFETIEDVYAIHGAFVIFNKQFLYSAIEELKKSAFLFGEEIRIAEVAMESGYKILFDSSLTIYHDEHQTTGLFKSKRSLHELKKSVDIHLKLFNIDSENNKFDGEI